MLKTVLILVTVVYLLVMVLLFWRYRVAMQQLEETRAKLKAREDVGTAEKSLQIEDL